MDITTQLKLHRQTYPFFGIYFQFEAIFFLNHYNKYNQYYDKYTDRITNNSTKNTKTIDIN